MRPGVDFAQGSDRDFGVNLRGVEPSHKKESQKGVTKKGSFRVTKKGTKRKIQRFRL